MSATVTLAATGADGQALAWIGTETVFDRMLALVQPAVVMLPVGSTMPRDEARAVATALRSTLDDLPDLAPAEAARVDVRALAAVLETWADDVPLSRGLIAHPPGVSILELGGAVKPRLVELLVFLEAVESDVTIEPARW